MSRSARIAVEEIGAGQAEIETYVAAYQRGVPAIGYVFARQEKTQARIIAKVSSNDNATLEQLFNSEPIGRPISVTHENGENFFTFGT